VCHLIGSLKKSLKLNFSINFIRIYFMENGLEISSKKFKEVDKICLLEFIEDDEKLLLIGSDDKVKLKIIIWDLYNTDEVKVIELDNTSLTM